MQRKVACTHSCMKKYKEKLKYVITGRLKNIQITSFHSGLATFLCHFATFRNLISIIRSFRAYISRNKYHHLIEQNQYTTKAIVSMTKTAKRRLNLRIYLCKNGCICSLNQIHFLSTYLLKLRFQSFHLSITELHCTGNHGFCNSMPSPYFGKE